MNPMGITVVLNGYKRHKNLSEQLSALNRGTVPPTEILLWYNHPEDDSELNQHAIDSTVSVVCNRNLGVWARFAYALNASSPFVCVLDDDTIPGSMWLENCMATMEATPGLLGTIGILYPNPLPPEKATYYDTYYRIGWAGNNEESTQVDFVGHSWFFKKEWLSYMWREIPDAKFAICGEDMHFSYMLQKYANIPTYVPPHPVNNQQMWGSVKPTEYGADANSLWQTNQSGADGTPFKRLMNEFFVRQRQQGWKLIHEK